MKTSGPRAVGAIFAAGILLLAASALIAQTAKLSVDVTVTDPYGRTVAGLEKTYFTVTEGGTARTITAFSEVRDENPKPAAHYKVEFESGSGGAAVEVKLTPPRGLPQLSVTWK